MSAHPTLRAHLTALPAPLTFGARMNLADLPDDYMRVGEPDLQDAPTVSRDQAVNSVISVLTGEAPTAFGEPLDYWLDVIGDSVAGNQRTYYLVVLAPGTFPSFPRYVANELGGRIERVANELLADMDNDQIADEGLSL